MEKYLVVDRGELRIDLAGEIHILKQVDAVYFQGDVAHRFDNVSKGVCCYYMVVSDRR